MGAFEQKYLPERRQFLSDHAAFHFSTITYTFLFDENYNSSDFFKHHRVITTVAMQMCICQSIHDTLTAEATVGGQGQGQ